MHRLIRALIVSMPIWLAPVASAQDESGQGPLEPAAPRTDKLIVPALDYPAPAPTSAIAPSSAATVTVPLPAGCENRHKAIGLSRIVEIDTTGGPRLGHSHYKDLDFLQDGEVVLTFDDGPLHRYTRHVLDSLDAHCTRATFFAVGRMALADPETLKETGRRGHTIASHTWSHAKLASLSAEKARHEIELGNSAVTFALGQPIAPFFRFPYLRDSKVAIDYLRSRNISAFSIEVDSQDFRTRNPGQVLRTVMTQLQAVKKGIILFHDIQPATAGALSSLLDQLKAGGFRVVHLISKSPNTTVPEFDALIAKEAERKRVALTAQPLADRAVTWRNSGQPDGTAANKRPDKNGDAFVKPAGVTPQSGALPWAQGGGEAAPEAVPGDNGTQPGDPALATPKPLRKPLWQADDDPWRIRTLGD